MRRVLVAALLAAVACGSSGSPAEDALRDTAKKLDDIRSAKLDLRMTATSAGAQGPVGFRMSGPFSLPEKEGLPVADVSVTELRGKDASSMRFVSTGQAAYVVRDGQVTKLSGDGGVKVGGESGGLGSLRIDSWLRDPKMTTDGDTQRITAGLNVSTALDDLGRLGERVGSSSLAGLRPLDDQARAALDKSAKDASIVVVTGKEDRLLRRLELSVTLTSAGDIPSGLRSLIPVTLGMTLDLADVNKPVTVDAPV